MLGCSDSISPRRRSSGLNQKYDHKLLAKKSTSIVSGIASTASQNRRKSKLATKVKGEMEKKYPSGSIDGYMIRRKGCGSREYQCV